MNDAGAAYADTEHAPSPKAAAIQYLATPKASGREFPIVFPGYVQN